MGITTPLFPEENTSNGRDVHPYDTVADPGDDGVDVVAFADFIRSTKAPSRGPIDADVVAGERVFARVGCAACHVAAITTARQGTATEVRQRYDALSAAQKTTLLRFLDSL